MTTTTSDPLFRVFTNPVLATLASDIEAWVNEVDEDRIIDEVEYRAHLTSTGSPIHVACVRYHIAESATTKECTTIETPNSVTLENFLNTYANVDGAIVVASICSSSALLGTGHCAFFGFIYREFTPA